MAIEKKNIIEEKCMNFSVEVVNLMKQIQKVRHEYKMSDQMMRAGTAVGASYGEAQYAESDLLKRQWMKELVSAMAYTMRI